MKQIEDEVVGVLKNAHTIGFEDIQDEQLSPLNKAVIEKDIAGVSQKQDWNIWKPEKRASQNSESTMEKEYRHVQQGGSIRCTRTGIWRGYSGRSDYG